jgi:protein-tyrosine phosphatase
VSYQHVIGLLGAVLVILGFVGGGWWLAAVWLGIDFLILAIAHAKGVHRIFGKRADGTLPFWSWLLYLPLLAYTSVVWHVLRALSREKHWDVVTPHLKVGRRLLPHEVVDETFANYVDLTAEFQEPVRIRKSVSYTAFPILDGSAPPCHELVDAVNRLRPGHTFIHCARGHGRTGLFAAAVLLRSGVVRNVNDAVQMLQSIRPGIRLNRAQLQCIEEFARNVA